MKRTLIRFLSLLLLFSLALSFAGCGGRKIAATDLMAGIVPRQASGEPSAPTAEDADSAADFAVRLFQAAYRDGKNNLISPLSVLSALAMTVNGAKGETLSEMEIVLGMTVDEGNEYFYRVLSRLPQGDKYKLHLANSIWFTSDESFTVNEGFLQTNADYFGAAAYRAPFDETTLSDINQWVKNETDGKIKKILDEISANTVMVLVNALSFDAEWATIYKKDQVKSGTFTCEDGREIAVSYLTATESTYLSDGQATGFVKPYSGGKYAFVALLPNEGVSLSDYVAALDGAALRSLLSGTEYESVKTMIPKFQVEDSLELSAVLSKMGMPLAFHPDEADFSGLGRASDGNLYVTEVLHKTFLSLDEKGTKAGAASSVKIGKNGSRDPDLRVYLDRPFVYLLIETESNTPFFIGTVADPTK